MENLISLSRAAKIHERCDDKTIYYPPQQSAETRSEECEISHALTGSSDAPKYGGFQIRSTNECHRNDQR